LDHRVTLAGLKPRFFFARGYRGPEGPLFHGNGRGRGGGEQSHPVAENATRVGQPRGREILIRRER
jgi:hypothetical protein